MLSMTISPEYSSFYVAGSVDVEIPIGGDHRTVRASADCLNIACLMYQDGDTALSVGQAGEFSNLGQPIFDGFLRTPERSVVVFDANEPEIARVDVPTDPTRIRVWANRTVEPDHISIGLG